jgi:uncharacterized membrane protein
MPPTSADPVARLAERQTWITDHAQSTAQNSIRNAFAPLGKAAQPARDALHGTWLHEPLHAIMTDIPVGSWTAAVVFDAVGALGHSRTMDQAADASVLLGLAGAAGAALTGLNDWAEITDHAPRRIGAVHALLNAAATLAFTASAIARRNSETRDRGRSLAILGFVIASASAHLGGNLVYEHGIGVRGNQQEG